MIDAEHLRSVVVKGLKEYIGVAVIRSNQNAEPPDYPYVSYTITTPESANNGTYGVYEDGVDRLPVTQTWSITVQSDKYDESLMLASKAREWLQHAGTLYLNDNDVIVQSVTNITNRDNLISVEYEYKHGFDCVFWLMNEVERQVEQIETINIEEYGINVSKN